MSTSSNVKKLQKEVEKELEDQLNQGLGFLRSTRT